MDDVGDAVICLRTHKSFGGRTQFWEHDSLTTKTKMRFSTFIPDGKVRGCLVWLSGTSCTEENFIVKAGAQRSLAAEQMMVIAPDTSPRGVVQSERIDGEIGEGASYYLDATTPRFRENFQMQTYVLRDVLGLVVEKFQVSPGALSIAGHSMGGHGALVLGLKHPTVFRSVSAMAPVSHPSSGETGRSLLCSALGDDPQSWRDNDATELVLSGRRHPHTIFVDQGLSDELFPQRLKTRNFVEACKKMGQPIDARFRDGYDHSYFYVASVIDEHVCFHAAAL